VVPVKCLVVVNGIATGLSVLGDSFGVVYGYLQMRLGRGGGTSKTGLE
jgi:hypothetical protein